MEQATKSHAGANFASIALSLAILASACGGGAGGPSGPSPPGASYTLSGAIAEKTSTVETPVEGVLIEEGATHKQATTDKNGFYSFSGLPAAMTRISATKAGYITNSRTVPIRGDTRVDFLITRLQTLAGTVTETVNGSARPLAGVALALGEGYEDLVATTDEEGRFSILGIPGSGVWDAVVSKSGYESQALRIPIFGDTTLAIVLFKVPGHFPASWLGRKMP